MTSDKKDILKSTIDDIFVVYSELDKNVNILHRPLLPKKLYEKDPNHIITSYYEYIEQHPKFEKTDIITKYTNKGYQLLYHLYHDVKIICASEIKQHKIGSDKYNDIDRFFKLTTEFLLREANKLGTKLFYTLKVSPTELETQLMDDFNKISYSYTASNGEVVTFISEGEEMNSYAQSYPHLYQNQALPSQQTSQPLFSSLVGRSQLDNRETIIPEPFQLSKVISLPRNGTVNGASLESLSPSISKIPAPTAQPTQILKDYFHPNWYTIYVPTWLQYNSKIFKPPLASSLLKDQNDSDLRLISRPFDSFKSFAPTVDLKRSIVTEESKSNVWLNHLGYKQMQSINDSNKISRLKKESPKPEEPSNLSNSDEDLGSLFSPPVKTELTVTAKEANKLETKRDINVQSLVNWDPEDVEIFNSIRKEKKEWFKSPRALQKAISMDLIRLNKLRQERYLRSNPQNLLSASSLEIKLYKRVVKLTSYAVELGSSPGRMDIKFNRRLPILTVDYKGSLPGLPPSKNASGTKSARLPSIRGPYKKKNRQL
ncbi:uncharacterized protein PRCAT00000989001 [Priceomyces carsonii]|uniref:uncharacterized protein n=1 Tax=Priceomyces carsonii TaxID=28549 RepID=UPI002ED89C87|nr:unnamed protein product [Priceomyces carsonii]